MLIPYSETMNIGVLTHSKSNSYVVQCYYFMVVPGLQQHQSLSGAGPAAGREPRDARAGRAQLAAAAADRRRQRAVHAPPAAAAPRAGLPGVSVNSVNDTSLSVALGQRLDESRETLKALTVSSARSYNFPYSVEDHIMFTFTH